MVPLGGLDQPGEAADQGRLPRAGKAHDDERLSSLDGEGRVPNRHQAIGLLEHLLPVTAFFEQGASSRKALAEDLCDLAALQG